MHAEASSDNITFNLSLFVSIFNGLAKNFCLARKSLKFDTPQSWVRQTFYGQNTFPAK